jgi:hypothetical protein
MEVTKVNANIRFSKDIGNGAWKVVELGCEATVGPDEDWTLCQSGLYAVLAGQLRSLWSQNTLSPEHASKGPEKAAEGTWEAVEHYSPPAESARPPARSAHWCSEHGTEFRKFEKDGRTWYSHKAGDGWCKERTRDVA